MLVVVLIGAVALPQALTPATLAEAGGIIFHVEDELVGGEIDIYEVTLEAGKVYEAFVNCPGDSDAVPLIDVVAPNGFLMTFENFDNGNCNEFGSSAYFGTEAAGTYTFGLFDANGTQTNGIYTFQVVEVETVVNEIVEFTAETGVVNPDWGFRSFEYDVNVPGGAILVIFLTCPTDAPIDPLVGIFDSAGNFFDSADDSTGAVCVSGPFGAPQYVARVLVGDTYTVYPSVFDTGSGLGQMQVMIGVVSGTGLPNLGLIDVPVGTDGYMTAGGEVYGNFVNDADGTGSDVMQITAFFTDADGNEWVALWMGSANPIWIPVSSGTILVRN